MKKGIVLAIVVFACCATLSQAFFGGNKYVDACNPDPCKNKAKCELNSRNKNISTCICTEDYFGTKCELKKGCASNPCKTGMCKNDPNDPSKFTCTCEKGMVGPKCDTKDACALHSTCKHGKCTLDAKLKPVCECEPGWGKAHCDKQNCSIVEFSGKNFESKPKVLHDVAITKLFKDLDALAKLCNVRIAPKRSFSLQADPTITYDADAPFYTGRALEFELNDAKGKPLCDTKCLSYRRSLIDGVQCILNGLDAINWQLSPLAANVIYDSSHQTLMKDKAAYNLLKKTHQIGCGPEIKETACEKDPDMCKNGKCTLDDKQKALCVCEPGWGKKNCDKRVCEIEKFKGKNFEAKPPVYIDPKIIKMFNDLDALAKICQVRIAPIKSFTMQLEGMKDTGVDAPFYTGHALKFELNDEKGATLCNSICLSKIPIPQAGAKCLFNGLDAIGWKWSILRPGIIQNNIDNYAEIKLKHQVGCKETSF